MCGDACDVVVVNVMKLSSIGSRGCRSSYVDESVVGRLSLLPWSTFISPPYTALTHT